MRSLVFVAALIIAAPTLITWALWGIVILNAAVVISHGVHHVLSLFR